MVYVAITADQKILLDRDLNVIQRAGLSPDAFFTEEEFQRKGGRAVLINGEIAVVPSKERRTQEILKLFAEIDLAKIRPLSESPRSEQAETTLQRLNAKADALREELANLDDS